MFIAALFTAAKIERQPRCPSMEEWIKSMWSTYTMEYYSAIKKNEIMPFAATWMDLEIIILSETEKTNDTTYTWNLKNDTNELINKTEILTDLENKLMFTRERRGWIN